MKFAPVVGCCAYLALSCFGSVPSRASVSFAAGSHVQTKFPVSDIAGKEHSISFRFRLEYPNSMTGTIIGLTSTTGGFYQISKRNTDSGTGDRPMLEVKIGAPGNPVTAVYANIENLKDGFEKDKWYHVVVTVDASRKLRVFVNGKRLSPRKQKLSDPDDVQLPAPPWGSGSLRFGRTAPFEQFYGQLDSVALWDHVLTTGDIATLAKQQQFSAKGLNGLLASWVFSGISGLGGPKGPGAFWELAGPARVISASDLKQPGARHSTKLSLPVIGKWRITQGADSSYDLPNKSHRGYASFCLDMVRDEGTTEGEPVLAAADGTVLMIRDTSSDTSLIIPGCAKCNINDCAYISNEVVLRHAPGEYTQYLHFMQGSVPSWIKEKLVSGEPVKRGRMIGRAGRSGTLGPHLHVCMGWATFFQPGPVTASGKDEPVTPNILTGACGYKPAVAPAMGMDRTRPFEFSGYIAETDAGSKFIDAATPQLGQVVRHEDRSPVFIDGFPPLALQAMHSDKCAQVNGASTDNGATVSQWDCVKQDNAKWLLIDAGDQHFFVKPQHSNKCLQVSGASHENGAAITQWECVDQDHHKWKVERLSPSGYYLRAKHSGKCAHVQAGSLSNGGILTQWDCLYQDNVRWELQVASSL